MHDSHLPWKVLSATLGLGVLTEGWNLADLPVDGSNGSRVFTANVSFASAFAFAPVVHLGITGFDMDQCASGRVSVKAVEITAAGFTVEVTTWRDSCVYAVELDWLAIGA